MIWRAPPPPTTFAEGQRRRMVWMLFGAGVMTTGLLIGAALIVWRGGWPVDLAGKQLDFLGWGMLAMIALVGIVIVSLAIGGPVGRFKARFGRDGAEWEAEDHDEPVAQVTTTVAVQPGDQQ